ncbi:MAG: hypothetical protein CMI00_05135 [Oceanospirillaceae bacterium]|nr:hypothetical protein [Oceanospirillaceae bacterium]|tara:strand:- start:3045 stop:3926 length:882 start_codon:yes stop_codon:yes gene_type:complete
MARNPNPTTVIDDAETISIRPEIAGKATEVVQIQLAQQESAEQLALQLRYDGPMHPDALEAGIADARSRIAAELFGMGARLLLLKEQCEHGEFMDRIGRLGLDHTLVNRTMQATLKFSNSAISQNLEKLSKSKLFELVVLDDDEIKELEYAGSVRGISIDDIDRMTVSDLRKQLREAKQLAEAKDKLLANKNTQIDELNTKLDGKAAKLIAPDEHLQRSLTEVTSLTQQITTTLGTVYRKALVEISDHHALHGGDSDRLLMGCMDQIESAVTELREAFTLINTDGWQQDIEEA